MNIRKDLASAKSSATQAEALVFLSDSESYLSESGYKTSMKGTSTMPGKSLPSPGLTEGCPGQPSCANRTALNLMALDTYIYGYPLVLTEVTRRGMLASGASVNRFVNARSFPDPAYTTIVRPNVDTLYSMAWLDLADEPVILGVPDTHGKYYLMELLDPWTNVFASIGARTTGTEAGAFAIAGPLWNGRLPAGVKRIDAPDNTVWVLGRTQTNGPKDYPLVHAIQNGYTLSPLSSPRQASSYYHSDKGINSVATNPVDQVAAMDAPAFFSVMVRAMHKNPPWIKDPVMEEKLATLGLSPSRDFAFSGLAPAIQSALRLAVTSGPQLIKASAAEEYAAKNSRGWMAAISNIGFYGADYLRRAIVALEGIGANLPQDAVYATAFIDSRKLPLAGYNTYRIHFDKNRFPPVHAFWSLTLYNEQGYLAKNPLHRYALSPHLGRLDYNPDGSLDLYVGSAPPLQSAEANWLPAPKSRFNLALRMYWPDRPILDRQWQPPPVERIE